MKRSNELPLRKSHKIMNRPILALVLMPLWCMVIGTLVSGLVDDILKGSMSFYAGGLGSVLGGFLCLHIHRNWFRDEFDGSLSARNFGMGFLMLLPSLIFMVLNLMSVSYRELSLTTVLAAMCMGAGPGVLEEVAFRGLAGSNMMRVWRDEKKIPVAVTLTAVVFGAVHLLNIFAGAGQAVSIVQTVYAIGAGVLFGAVYFRTGSLLPSMLVHTLVDGTAFLNADLMSTGGVLMEEGFDPMNLLLIVVGIGFAVLGFWYVRPAKRQEILDLWAKKWNVSAEAEEATVIEESTEA